MCACGGGCPRCRKARLPRGIELGRIDDPLEREADRLAQHIVRHSDHEAPDPPDADEPLSPLARLRRLAEEGSPLPHDVRALFENRVGIRLDHVRVHTDTAAAARARAIHADAFTLGTDIVFADGRYQPNTGAGLRLLAHELAHVLQQTLGLTTAPGVAEAGGRAHFIRSLDAGRAGVVRRSPDCVSAVADPDEEVAPEEGVPVPHVPDDERVDRAIDWPTACEKNRGWWSDLLLEDTPPLRDIDPVQQPRAWANTTLRAQRLMYDNGIRLVEGAPLDRDGIFGPRMLLALLRLAEDANHPARPQVQGLGFDLDVILAAEDAIARARAFAQRPEFLLQAPIEVLGETAVRYYDINYFMGIQDRDVLDGLLFGGPAPEDVRREDRIELLRRLYGRGERRLHGTVALVKVRRDFIHRLIDFHRAVERDARRSIDRANWFAFAAQSAVTARELESLFGSGTVLIEQARRLPADRQEPVRQAAEALRGQTPEPLPTAPRAELFAILVAIYLPVLDESVRAPVVQAYLAEKAAREEAERQRIEANNRVAARQRADALVALIDDEDMYRPLRMVGFQSALRDSLSEKEFFDLVLDDLAAREGNYFVRLFDAVEEVAGDSGLGALVELSLAGRHRNHPRVRRALATLIDRHAQLRRHGYVVTGGGAVLLDGDERVEVGQVIGTVNSAFLRDEDREQLKPDSQRRLENQLEVESRAYMASLLEGNEPERTQDQIGKLLMERAWLAAGLTEDHDIEDVEWQESLRLLGVRRAADSADGVPRYEVQYQRVERVVGGTGGDTEWAPIGGADWRSESDFEYALFWYSYSQSADIMITAAKVVVIGALVVVAWEAGVIAALVTAGGGAVPVGLSIAVSLAVYLIFHERRTLEGLLVAGLEGYLAAVGFRVFAPVGQAVGRLVLPAALEQVALRRVVVAWLLRHGTVGALTGGTLGPASLLIEDLVRIARRGGGLSPFAAYLGRAGWGMVLGAVFEIGGSLLLAPLFRAADQSVLGRLSEVVNLLRGRQPAITPSEWLSEVAVSLSKFRGFLGAIADDAIANGIFTTVRQRMQQAGSAWLTGVRGTLQREIIELSGATLSRDAADGLERLLRLGRATLSDDALATLLQQARRTPERIDPWLRFLSGIEDAAASGLVTRGQLRALLDSEAVLALAARRTSAEMVTLMSTRFANSLDDLEQFAARANALDDAVADRVLEALHSGGTAVTPRSVLRIAESGAALGDDTLGGLRRMLDGADAGRMEAVLEAMADDQVAPFLTQAHTAPAPELDAMRRVVAAHEAPHVAWAVRLPIAEAETLLTQLSANARATIRDISAAEARDLIGELGIGRVNNALSLGADGPVRGSHLRALRQRFPARVVEDMLDSAGTAAGRLRRIARVASNLDGSVTRLPGSAVGPGTLTLDTNARAAVDDLVRGFNKRGDPVNVFADLDENYRDAIGAIRGARRLGAYVDPPGGMRPTIEQIVGPGADLRATEIAGAEALAGEAISGRASSLLPELRGVLPDRAHPDYSRVVNDMATGTAIGGREGALDRAMVADVMFSQTTGGATPKLVTVDTGIATRLADRYAVAPRTFSVPRGADAWKQLIARFPEGHFRIEILSHPLDITFHAPTGLKPSPP